MVRIAVVDDEKTVTDCIEIIIKDFFQARQMAFEITCYQLPNELLMDLEGKSYFDIYFLDIEMSVNGLDVAKAVRQLYFEPYIVFVTAYVQYSVRGYEYSAFRYIVKNELEEKLPQALELICEQLKNREHRQYVIETVSRFEKIDYSDLYYMHIEGKYTYFYTRNGTTKIRKPLGTVFKELDAKEFIYADKGYVVNIQHVMRLKDKMAVMRDGQELPVSIPQFKKLKKAISDYGRGNK